MSSRRQGNDDDDDDLVDDIRMTMMLSILLVDTDEKPDYHALTDRRTCNRSLFIVSCQTDQHM